MGSWLTGNKARSFVLVPTRYMILHFMSYIPLLAIICIQIICIFITGAKELDPFPQSPQSRVSVGTILTTSPAPLLRSGSIQ